MAQATKIGPKISIVIPNYNDGNYLEETIRSVLDQGYPNLDLILIDGGSTDNSLEVVRKYQNYFSYWTSEPDGGAGPAVAKGLEKASGDILAWLCSNDLYLPGTLALVANTFESNRSVDLIYGFSRWIDANGKFLREDRTEVSDFHKAMLFAHWSPPQHSCFWRRELYGRCKVDPKIRVSHDFDFFLRASYIGKVMCLKRPLAAIRLHPRPHQVDIDCAAFHQDSWKRFIIEHRIPRVRIVAGSILWGPKVRYATGGWREVLKPVRLEYLRKLFTK